MFEGLDSLDSLEEAQWLKNSLAYALHCDWQYAWGGTCLAGLERTSEAWGHHASAQRVGGEG